MKECSLCDGRAEIYCESDDASLCYDCDSKVHSANFLVAKHTRILLCRSCQSQTPWKASGSKLGKTISICEKCFSRCNRKSERDEVDKDHQEEPDDENDDDDDDDEEEGESDDEDEEYDSDDEEDSENQVVPWSAASPPSPSSSSSESGSVAETTSRPILSLKRMRDLTSQDDFRFSPCLHSQSNPNLTSMVNRIADDDDEETTSGISFRPLKDRKLGQIDPKSSSPHLLCSLNKLKQEISFQ